MDHPDYIVIRPAADLPAGFLPARWDGLWLNRSGLGPPPLDPFDARHFESGVVAVPTGRVESREDGVVAEVWEVRP